MKWLKKYNARINIRFNIEMDNSVLHELEAKPMGTFLRLVPIMNGCNKFCTYCIVPHVRGREISRPMQRLWKMLKNSAPAVIRRLPCLAKTLLLRLRLQDGTHFGDLIDALDGIPGIERIRYMTSHPQDMNKEMIDALGRSSNVVTQLHLPIQSGSNRILQKMNRRYTVEHYKAFNWLLSWKIDGLTLTTDLIVGFPGETEEDFQATCNY